ncbi:hypothetical protein HMI56_007397 [Coelomomyces lativittatus]|nr:hypothetical protein HMI56_007397 [Coelomomyces lativittatus]
MLRFFFKPLIPPSAHSYLKQYKYVGVDKSFLSKYILNYYWNWVVQWFPLWMAPNLITLIGFCFILLNTGLTLFYSPDLISPVPSYCYYIFGVGIFIYQTLDAIDGKQARRTNQSSPLGHFFDHGCDALNTMLTVITMAPVLRIGGSPILLLSIFLSLGNFYLTTWEEYVTGTLYLGYFSGPVEGVLLISLMLVSLGYFGM